jgi:hypothetical protein
MPELLNVEDASGQKKKKRREEKIMEIEKLS